jgi:hypothetical protein
VLAPLAVLATWAPIFAMISGSAHAYVIHGTVQRRMAEGKSRDEAFKGVIRGAFVNSACLYGLSLINMMFLHHAMEFNGEFRYTMLTSTLQDGMFHPYSAQLLFYNDALALIASSTLAVTILLWLLWRNGGMAHPRRNFAVITAVTLALIGLSPALHVWLDPKFYEALDHGRYGTAFLLKLVVGPNQSPLPNVAYGLLGAILGVAVAQQIAIKRIRRFGYGVGACFIAASAAIISVKGVAIIELTYHTFPIKLHLLNMGLMLWVSTFLIDKMEYQPEARREVLAGRTRFFRRFGIAALSVFLLEGVMSVVLGKLYIPLWSATGEFPRVAWAIIPFLALLIGVWHVTLRAWERWDFRYGAEWWLVQIVGAIRGRKSLRLQTQHVIYRPVCEAED